MDVGEFRIGIKNLEGGWKTIRSDTEGWSPSAIIFCPAALHRACIKAYIQGDMSGQCQEQCPI